MSGDKNSAERLKDAGLETLHDRRIARCTKFAEKMAKSERFGHWFPPHQNNCQMTLRSQPQYQELQATTNRRYDSPLFFMRRLMNERLKPAPAANE